MKLFCIHIIKLLLILIMSLYALDFLYSKVYSNSKYRNKIQYALNENPKNYDVVFLGSSRANNHFVASEFDKIGMRTFNFGISGGSLQETCLLLEVLLEKKNRIKNIILEIDLNIRDEGYSRNTRALFMPYLNNNLNVSQFYKLKLQDFNLKSNFPFYRYIKDDAKIGFRELILSSSNKKAKFIDNKGYSPLNLIKNNLSYDLRGLQPTKNKYYEAIKEICKKNNIKLIVVMTPMCENTKGLEYFEKVKKLYPEIHNFENAITDDKYFSSCGHLNDEGAKKFTNILIDSLKF